MNKYPSHNLSPPYPLTVYRSYSPQSYYYPSSEYRSYFKSNTPDKNARDRHLSYYDQPYSFHYHYYSDEHSDQKLPPAQYSFYPKENRARTDSSQVQQQQQQHLRAASVVTSGNALMKKPSHRFSTNQLDNDPHTPTISMVENDSREHGVLKRDKNRPNTSFYKTLTEEEFLSKTQSEIRQEFRKMLNPPAKDPYAAKDPKNLDKSRYRDVIPGESTRVKLQPDGEDKHDFINANYVSGYNNQEKAYIFTQGPLPTTVRDFWRMVWQENISVIVMTTNIRESGMVKCHPYWPGEQRQTIDAGLYQIQNEFSERFNSFVVTTLKLRKRNQPDEVRTIYHAHYQKWPDHGVPAGTRDALEFLDRVEFYRQKSKTRAPVLLHCSAGIGRTGTFCAIDNGIKRYLEQKTIDIASTVLKMRHERSGSVQTEDQYVFAYLALMDFIREHRANEQRSEEYLPVLEKHSLETSDGNQRKVDGEQSQRKLSRPKSNGKKIEESEQSPSLSSTQTPKSSNLFEPSPSYRAKTFSDSSVSALQFLTPAQNQLQTEATRQRALTEQISSSGATNVTALSSAHHKKARK